jgi:hypothetical protein
MLMVMLVVVILVKHSKHSNQETQKHPVAQAVPVTCHHLLAKINHNNNNQQSTKTIPGHRQL